MAKAKAASTAFEEAGEAFRSALPQFGFPQFGFPSFEFPRMEVPAAYRELAEKSIAQAKQNYERTKATAEEANELFEATFTTAVRGASEYSLKLIENLRANTNANLDFARDLFAVKSASEAVELSSTHARKQFDTISLQGKELASLVEKVSNDTAEPIKAGFNKALRAVA
jgi:phasin